MPMSSQPTFAVAVLIASIGRPQLRETLVSLSRASPGGHRVRVVIADDSADRAVSRVIAGLDIGLEIAVVSTKARNLAVARNAGLEAALGDDFAAIIDDDQIAEPDWLISLVAAAETYRADAVIGAVTAAYPEDAPPWVRGSGLWNKDPGPTGTRVRWGPTGSSLVRMATIRACGLRFREEFGRTGGEDTDFFNRLTAAGGVIVACPTARVCESIPADRLSFEHLRLRFRRNGHTRALVSLEHSGARAKALFYARSLARLLVMGTAAQAVRLVRRDLHIRCAIRVWASEGELAYAKGRAGHELYS